MSPLQPGCCYTRPSASECLGTRLLRVGDASAHGGSFMGSGGEALVTAPNLAHPRMGAETDIGATRQDDRRQNALAVRQGCSGGPARTRHPRMVRPNCSPPAI